MPAPLDLPLAEAGRVLGWTGSGEVLALLVGEGSDSLDGVDAYALSIAPLDGSATTTLMQISGLQSYGVGRFQLAASAADRLEVVSPDDVDRGPWSLGLRIVLAAVAGLLTWLVAAVVARVVRRRQASRDGYGPAGPGPASTVRHTSSSSMS